MTPLPPCTLRESSNEQDAAGTTAETAVQGRPSRSIPKRLRVQSVPPAMVRPLMVERHYLRAMAAAPRRCYGVFLDGVLRGGVVFTSGARHGYRLLSAARPQDVATLARLWLSDELPANSESRVLGIVLRDLRRTTSWKLLLSYADPAAGHVGTIYQATGWRYLGETAGETYVRLADGRLHHPRSVFTQFGSNRIGHLNATGIIASREEVGGKHRYAYVLDPAWSWRLRDVAHPSSTPTTRSRGPPAPAPGNRGSRPDKQTGGELVPRRRPNQERMVHRCPLYHSLAQRRLSSPHQSLTVMGDGGAARLSGRVYAAGRARAGTGPQPEPGARPCSAR